MIAGRVAANHEHQVGVLEVFELDRRRAAAGDARQPDAAGLMAVEAAIVDVVRAVEPGEELQQEAGFVAAAAAEVPECFIGRRGAQLRGDAVERLVPGDRRVAAGLARVANGLDEPAAVLPARAAKVACSSRGRIRAARSRCGWRPACRRPSPAGLFLQTSGKWPSSLTMPPRWPPMPSAQVLQAFFERIARQSLSMPPASRAFCQV